MTLNNLHALGISFSGASRDELLSNAVALDPVYSTEIYTTANMQHFRTLHQNAEFKKAYQASFATTIDGMPLVWLIRLAGVKVERYTGVDFTLDVMSRAARGTRVRIVGGTATANKAAEETLRQKYPHLEVLDGFTGLLPEVAVVQSDFAFDFSQLKADIVLLCLGSPKQEYFANKFPPGVVKKILCVGATVDFLAGEKKRAPEFIQRSGFEWIWRLAQEPKRLAGRYFHDGITFIRNLPIALTYRWRTK